MTPREFKAWFEGFTEAFSGIPNKTQWARIKERVAEIDGQPITQRIFVDRYWPTYYPQWAPISGQTFTIPCSISTYSTNGGSGGTGFNSTTAMYSLGVADSKACQ